MKKLTKAQRGQIAEALKAWYTVGWQVGQERVPIDRIVSVLQAMAVFAHVTWQNDILQGEEVCEDISPAEGILTAACVIKHLADKAGVKTVERDDMLNSCYTERFKRDVNRAERALIGTINEVAPGYMKTGVGGDGKKQQ